MKFLSIKSMAWMAAMVSTSLSAQATVPDESIDQSKQFTITKVKYQDGDELNDKSFSGYYYLTVAAAGSTLIDGAGDYSYGNTGCFYENNSTGGYDTNLHLPDGHQIVGVRYYFKDGSASSSRVYLYRMDGDGTFSQLHSVASTGNSGTYSYEYTGLATSHYVDNAKYSYVLRFESSETGINQKMCGARLFLQATP